jgi:hypothetical protein
MNPRWRMHCLRPWPDSKVPSPGISPRWRMQCLRTMA